jgi:hypothetical protein
MDPSSLVFHSSDHQEESIDPTDLVDILGDVAMTKKRPTWFPDTLQDAVWHIAHHDTFMGRKLP